MQFLTAYSNNYPQEMTDQTKMTEQQPSASRSSILKEAFEASPVFEDVDLYDWNEDVGDEDKKDDKKRHSRHHHHRPHHEHPILPPQYFEVQPTPAAQPPPYTRSIFTTGISPATRRWLIALTVSLVVLIITLVLVVTLAVHPPAQQAPPQQTASSVPVDTESQSAPTATSPPTSNVHIAVVTATEIVSITAMASDSGSPVPTSMLTATKTEAFQAPVQATAKASDASNGIVPDGV